MRDAGYAHRRREGARSDQQPPAANQLPDSCQPASQPKGPWGNKRRRLQMEPSPHPSPSRQRSQQQRSRQLLSPLRAVWLSPGSTCRLPSMRVCACWART